MAIDAERLAASCLLRKLSLMPLRMQNQSGYSKEEYKSVARGMVVSGILIYALPALSGADFIWFAMPITELLVAIIVIILMYRGISASSAARS